MVRSAALELGRVHKHWHKNAPEKADKRAEALVLRVLKDNWAFRRIQDHCQSIIRGDVGDAAKAPVLSNEPPVLFEDGRKRLVVFRERLGAASDDQRATLARVLLALVEELQ
jgi:hypothetical protein